jgi:hypothetical protein
MNTIEPTAPEKINWLPKIAGLYFALSLLSYPVLFACLYRSHTNIQGVFFILNGVLIIYFLIRFVILLIQARIHDSLANLGCAFAGILSQGMYIPVLGI